MKEGRSRARLIDFLHHKPRRWINVLSGESKSFIINVVHPSINRRGDRKQTADRRPSLTVSTPQCLIFPSFSIVRLSGIVVIEEITLEDFTLELIGLKQGRELGQIDMPKAHFYHSDRCSVLSCAFLSCAVSGYQAAVVQCAPEYILEGQTEASGAPHLMSASRIVKMK